MQNGPRTIDIDILLYGNFVMKTEELEIPHPRYRERRFTLAPLAELNPELRDPVTRQDRWRRCWRGSEGRQIRREISPGRGLKARLQA